MSLYVPRYFLANASSEHRYVSLSIPPNKAKTAPVLEIDESYDRFAIYDWMEIKIELWPQSLPAKPKGRSTALTQSVWVDALGNCVNRPAMRVPASLARVALSYPPGRN